ncbi:Hypothetical predicted protein [Mytilus galloprovincialis]|uniref:Mab-21-like HhH/H2TH-like domain-containing protein n=1 Tax=Mytilus galloprovincialis TaxID=29158 RepID=A0A8B6BWA2_MYTGA|nr:Hypothetical predicted protein [Mytilus galloprovincialis]
MSVESNESLTFYKYLCQKIGSEEIVRIRRLAFTISDLGEELKLITSGSQGEGLNIKGSDIDVMMIHPYLKVFQSEQEVNKGRHIPFIMNNEESPPCFAKLCLLNHPNHIHVNLSQEIMSCLQKSHLGYVLSSELFKLCFLNSNCFSASYCSKIHGPCISDINETNDLAICLKCDKWILQARPWICRARTRWPAPELIYKIISCGVLFVPIGCKGSINENIEWRISFSVAEKHLIFSFSHTQLLCYALLKIVLKEIVDTNEDLKSLLCSYFLKTLMFWILEETDTYAWRPENIIQCFMACLQRLLYCVRYSTLSHYFIPDNNLFYLRFNTIIKEKLITILTNLYGQGINCFASSYTLHDYKSQSYESTESLISRNSRFMQQILPTFCLIRRHVRVDRVLRLLYNFLHSSRTALSRILFALQISEVSMYVPEVRQNPNSSENKNRYYIYKHDLIHLVIGFNSDAVSGLLKLASFFYVHKNYGASLTVITYALQKYTDEKIYTRLFKQEIRFNPIQKHVLNLMKKEKLHTMIKTLAIFPFTFELESPLIPQELHLDVTRTPTSFYPLSFAHFLNFLCSYHLHDISSCRQSLQRLKHDHWTLSSGGTVVFEPESLNTMIFWGLCYQLMGETYLARETFREAAKQDRYNASSAASRLSSLTC